MSAYASVDARSSSVSGTSSVSSATMSVSKDQYELQQKSSSTVDTSIPLQGSSVCVWSASGEYVCDGASPLYLKAVTAGSALIFEGFKSSAKSGNFRKGQEGFCDCGVDAYTLN
jgi:hypothetical protein